MGAIPPLFHGEAIKNFLLPERGGDYYVITRRSFRVHASNARGP